MQIFFIVGVCVHVDIKLKEYGLEKVEVCDNGSGIPKSEYQNLSKCADVC